MRLFLDASVVLAACGRPAGGSHAVFDLAGAQGWRLLRSALAVVTDELTHPWPVVFPAAKDRPVLFTAAAVADVLLTLDRADFGGVMAAGFYGLPVMKPGDFFAARACGRTARYLKKGPVAGNVEC